MKKDSGEWGLCAANSTFNKDDGEYMRERESANLG
jgi:hypothetical protein